MQITSIHNLKQPQMAPAFCGSFDVRGYEWNIMMRKEGHTY